MEESEKRRERLKAMRMEASRAGLHNEVGNSAEPRCLANPLIETSASPLAEMNLHEAPRFDYYTNPMAAFSASKRTSKVSNQNSTDYFTAPRPVNPEMTPSSLHQVQTDYSPGQIMFQARGPSYVSGPRNPEMIPTYQAQNSYSPDPRMYPARGPNHGPAPNNPELSPYPAHFQTNYSPDQRMYQARGPYHNSGPHGNSMGMDSPFGIHQGTPRLWNGSVGASSSHLVSNSSGSSNFSSPSSGGSSSTKSGQGRGRWFSNSPGSNSGYGGSPSYNSGRGRGRWSNNMRTGLGHGNRGSTDNVSAEIRPDLYYHKSMVEDPWKLLQPVVWKRVTPSVKSWITPGSLKPSLPKSAGIKKARILEESSSQPSLAEYLAAAFNDAVSDEARNDNPSL